MQPTLMVERGVTVVVEDVVQDVVVVVVEVVEVVEVVQDEVGGTPQML